MKEGKGYTEEYYRSHLGPQDYIDNPVYPAINRVLAENLKRILMPRSVLDVGCACGYLVSGFRRIGVDAFGVDSSEYALGKVIDTCRQYCRKAVLPKLDLPEGFPSRYDLVTCIEVLEHIPERDAAAAVSALTELADTILFSSTPGDWDEETHVNVHPLSYWCGLFAERGFFPDVEIDLSFGPPQFILFRKRETPPSAADLFRYMDTLYFPRAAKEAEAVKLSQTANERLTLIRDYQTQVAAKDAEIAKLSQLANERLTLISAKDAETVKFSDLASERLALLRDYQTQIAARDAEIAKLSGLADERLALVKDLQVRTAAKEAETVRFSELANERLALVKDGQIQAAAKDAEIAKLSQLANERLALVKGMEVQTAAKEAEIAKLSQLADERLALVKDMEEQTAAKGAEIAKLSGLADERLELVKGLQVQLSEKDAEAAKGQSDLRQYGESLLKAYRDFQAKVQLLEDKNRALVEENSAGFDLLSQHLKEYENLSREHETLAQAHEALGREQAGLAQALEALRREHEALTQAHEALRREHETVSAESELRRQELELIRGSRAFRLSVKLRNLYNFFLHKR